MPKDITTQLIEMAEEHPYNIAPDRFIRLLSLKAQTPTVINAMWNLFLMNGTLPTIDEAKQLVKDRRAKPKEPSRLGRVKSHFFDSGSFALWTKAAKYAKDNGKSKYAYYDTDEFWQYMDNYAAFVKAHPESIDHYANVDVIPNPELSYRNQKYLEDKHGLSPIPVVHYTTDVKWLRRYLKEGYEFVALGGLVGSIMRAECREWIDTCFNCICDNTRRLPKVKVHGFGLTAFEPMIRYPWWSVDSTSWAQKGIFGLIVIPRKKQGKFRFDVTPTMLSVTTESPLRRKHGAHLFTLSREERKVVDEWLDMIGVPIGVTDVHGNRVIHGITNSQPERILVYLRFFDEMVKTIPEWPWPFTTSLTTRGKPLGMI